ncbi:MAG: NAD-dependent epimerase/dehydratase family protein [Candidatus Dormibacteraeota bacterium]|nr:NAD-dependent epimerase/dehydratase family protein [Candidatus Dormibacteraeota bacterium]
MRTLVTGGAGFIGSHLVDRLTADGDDVDVLDDLSTGRMSNLEQQRENARVRVVEGSILDEPAVENLVSACDRVFHLAAAVGVAHIVNNPLASLLVNSRGTENVLAAAARHHRRVLIASSSEVYGKTESIPMHEDDDRILGSTAVHRWSYATAKALDEHLALAYAREGLRVVIVRYFNIYGPRMDPRGYGSVMANFLQQASTGQDVTVYGDGLQRRCFTYVDDCVEGTMRAMETEAAESQAFNIGDPTSETTILDLARLIVDVTGSTSHISHLTYEQRFGPGFEDTLRRVPAVERAHERLGWRASVPLSEGLRRTIASLATG